MTHLSDGACLSCSVLAKTEPAPHEQVTRTEHWSVAVAFNSTLPGWLVVYPNQHLESFTELSAAAADELGGLLRRLSLALEQVTGCTKTYQMQFSEAAGFSHLHVHLVPRMPDQPESARGPRCFTYLAEEDETQWLPVSERDAIALAVRTALRRL